MDIGMFVPAEPVRCKPFIYYIALMADIAKCSEDRGVAELVLDLAYGMADVMHDEALSLS
jgi:hypothetical protein